MRPKNLKVENLRDLSDERWHNHDRMHIDLAVNLKEYKETSNAWRASLLDLRGTFLPRAEYEAEHRATQADFGASVKEVTLASAATAAATESRISLLEDFVKTSKVRDETARSFFSNGRNIALFVVAVISTILATLSVLDSRLPK